MFSRDFKQVSGEKMQITNKPKYFQRNIKNVIAEVQFRKINAVITKFAYCPNFDYNPIKSCQGIYLGL